MNIRNAISVVALCVGVGAGVSWASSPEIKAAPVEIESLIHRADDASILTDGGAGAVVLDNVHHPILAVGFDMISRENGDEFMGVIAIIKGTFDTPELLVVVPIDFEEEGPDGRVYLVNLKDDVTHAELDAQVYKIGDDDEMTFGFSGEFEVEEPSDDDEKKERIEFRFAIDGGGGTSTFRLEDKVAYLNGELGSSTYKQVEYLIKNHPEVKKIVFEEVPGSINDEVNVLTGRMIRDAGYTTEIKSDSMIASGGVDLFLAGTERIVADGARVGVHSWSDGGDEMKPADLPRDHPAHRHQIKYFSYVMPDNGVDFYFYTLNAAPAEGIHWMSDEEKEEWGIATE